MAIEEQVYESMKNIAKQLAIGVAFTGGSIATDLLDYLKTQNKENDNDQECEIALDKLKERVKKGEELRFVVVPDDRHEEFREDLKKNKVLFAASDIVTDNAKVFFYLERDEKAVAQARELLSGQSGLLYELRPDIFINQNNADYITFISGLDSVDLGIFRYYVEQEGITYSVIKNGQGFELIVNNKDKQKAMDLLEKVKWDLSSSKGEILREHVQYHLMGKIAPEIAAEDAQREFYIVNGLDTSSYVHITANDFIYYKNKNVVLGLERNNPEFLNMLDRSVKCFSNPIYLSPEEFSLDEKKKETLIRHKMEIFPQEYDEMVEQNKLIQWKSLIRQGLSDPNNDEIQKKLKNRMDKMALDDEHHHSFEVDDDSLTYSDFSSYEFIHDQDELLYREKEFKRYQENRKQLRKYEVVDIQPEEGSVEFCIQKAENERRRVQEEKEKQKKLYQHKYAQYQEKDNERE